MIAFRGPAPVTAAHSSQGSCPGVGVVKLKPNGKFGKLVTVLRTTNDLADTLTSIIPAGGVQYDGKERSDVHGTIQQAELGCRDLSKSDMLECGLLL
jgi:hypothetical protein